MVVVVGLVMTSERNSGKELWSNADGFPHISCEEARVELNELPSSRNELNDFPSLLYHSGVYLLARLPIHFLLSLVTEP